MCCATDSISQTNGVGLSNSSLPVAVIIAAPMAKMAHGDPLILARVRRGAEAMPVTAISARAKMVGIINRSVIVISGLP